MRTVLALLSLFIFVSPAAFGSGETGQCQSAGEGSNKQCDGGGSTAVASGQDLGGAVAKASTVNMTKNSGALGSTIDQQIAANQAAISSCQSALSSCKTTCENLENAAAGNPQSDPASSIKGAKEGSCTNPLDTKIKSLEASQKELLASKADAGKTEEATQGSGGGMPQMPQQGEDGSGGSEDRHVACTSSEGIQAKECEKSLLESCKGETTETSCRAFNEQYCSEANHKSNGYCSDYALAQMCTRDSRCLTCKKRAAEQQGATVLITAAALEQNRSLCPNDPINTDGTVGIASSSPTAVAVAAPIDSGAADSGSSVSTGYDEESLKTDADKTAQAVGQGVGGASSQSVGGFDIGFNTVAGGSSKATFKKKTKEEEEEELKKNQMGFQSFGAAVSGRDLASSGGGREVGDQFGGSLFNLSSEAYESYRCKTDPRCLH